ALDSCAAGVGAPHIRQRLWIAAERLVLTDAERLEGYAWDGDRGGQRRWVAPLAAGSPAEAGGARRLADARSHELAALRREPQAVGGRSRSSWHVPLDVAPPHGGAGRLADPDEARRPIVAPARRLHDQRPSGDDADGRRGPRGVDDAIGNGRPARWHRDHAGDERIQPGPAGPAGRLADPGGGRFHLEQGKPAQQGSAGFRGHKSLDGGEARWTGPVNGYWAAADWLHCRDER